MPESRFWFGTSVRMKGPSPYIQDEDYFCLGVGSYHLIGGNFEGEGENPYATFMCPECGQPAFLKVNVAESVFTTSCEECGISLCMISNIPQQMNWDTYGDLVVSDLETLHNAMYHSVAASIIGTFNFLKNNVYLTEGSTVQYQERFLEYINNMLSVSMFRNDNSFRKLTDAIAARVLDNTVPIDMSDACLFSSKNINKYFRKLKVQNVNIFTGEEVGMPNKMVYISTKFMPIYLPYEIFEEKFLERLVDLKGTKLKANADISSFKLAPKTSLKTMKFGEGVCPACGSALEEEDVVAAKCLQCSFPMREPNPLYKKVVKKKVVSDA